MKSILFPLFSKIRWEDTDKNAPAKGELSDEELSAFCRRIKEAAEAFEFKKAGDLAGEIFESLGL